MTTTDAADRSQEAAALEAGAALAMVAGDAVAAAALLDQALALQPPTIALHLSLAAARRRLGALDAALESVDCALALQPRDFTALLMRASLIERLGRTREAATAYGAALTQAPLSLEALNEPTRRAALHAQEVHARHRTEMGQTIQAGSVDALAACDEAEARRVQAFIDDITGRRRRYRQEPSGFFYPGLPAIDFYDRVRFPWLERLEAATDLIERELAALVSESQDGFVPYVNYRESLPLDQWRALNRSPDWSAFHLYLNGALAAPNCARCPCTMEALSHVPQPQLPGRSPAAMFSVLKPHTRIPPHTGVSNTRLVCHLPLIVPPDCRFRVGAETRTWRRGQAWVFDDTIEHEAMNDSDRDRIILIFDVKQPAISPAEHAAIAAVAAALDAFGGGAAPAVL